VIDLWGVRLRRLSQVASRHQGARISNTLDQRSYRVSSLSSQVPAGDRQRTSSVGWKPCLPSNRDAVHRLGGGSSDGSQPGMLPQVAGILRG
jgi:hypothetical protein